ncbi:MAG: endonuclease MutS2, partial [Nitrospirota bacterium]|nr:endonuclease MutS2 [Nitrospirota bacterium]
MDEHTLRVLEFGKILQMAASFAVTVAGRQAVLEIRPLENIGDARRRLDLVSECRRLLNEGQPPGIENFDDLTPLFRRIRPADAVLEPFAIRSFLPLFYSAVNLKTLSGNTLCPGIGDIVSRLTCHPEILRSINASIDNEGKIRDEASPGLSEIRRNMKVHEQKISGILEDTLKQKDLEPHLQDHFIAERNKRFVIPVKMDSKGSVPGIVHDISNTGETVYIEPYAIHRHGNELESLRAEEKVEEFRIL